MNFQDMEGKTVQSIEIPLTPARIVKWSRAGAIVKKDGRWHPTPVFKEHLLNGLEMAVRVATGTDEGKWRTETK